MAEPTVQVPVSLVERAWWCVKLGAQDPTLLVDLARHLPPALTTDRTEYTSIADMASGTTFVGDRPDGHLIAVGGNVVRKHGRRFMKLTFGADSELVNDMGELVDADEIDPSTIRDVRPPA